MNDHGLHKTEYTQALSQVLGLGDVRYCDGSVPEKTHCKRLSPDIVFVKDALHHLRHTLQHVPSAATANV